MHGNVDKVGIAILELRDALLLVLASAVALVFAHGVWRAYFGNQIKDETR